MNSGGFNSINHMYLLKVSRLREIYERSVRPVEEQLSEVKQKISLYMLKISRGYKESPLISDDSRNICFFPEKILLEDTHGICIDVIENINKNTMVNIYHFWEKYWFDIIKGIEYGRKDENGIEIDFQYKDFKRFDKFISRISKYYELNEDINKLKDISNALKHGNRNHIRRMISKYPNLFERTDEFFISCFGADAISIKRADVEEAFEILLESGPKTLLVSKPGRYIK